MVDPTLANALETLIDRNGLKAIVESLAEVCSDKAEHIQSNWQDRRLSRVWHGYAVALSLVAERVTE